MPQEPHSHPHVVYASSWMGHTHDENALSKTMPGLWLVGYMGVKMSEPVIPGQGIGRRSCQMNVVTGSDISRLLDLVSEWQDKCRAAEAKVVEQAATIERLTQRACPSCGYISEPQVPKS